MSRTLLVPCPGCCRHVRTSETQCPFCAAALPGERRAARARRPRPPKGASRAARFAFQTALLAGSACTATHEGSDLHGSDGTAGSGPPDTAVAAMDAGAAFDNGSMPVAVQHSPSVRVEPDPDDDAGFAVPIYGGPFPDPKSRAKV